MALQRKGRPAAGSSRSLSSVGSASAQSSSPKAAVARLSEWGSSSDRSSSEAVSDNLIVDFDELGKPVGVTLLPINPVIQPA